MVCNQKHQVTAIQITVPVRICLSACHILIICFELTRENTHTDTLRYCIKNTEKL